jgi:hypothetical protein
MMAAFAPMLALAARGDADSLDLVVKIVAGVAVVALPLIKAALEARAKARQLSDKDPDRFGRGSEARKRFEALMRGEPLADEPPPSARPPVAAPPVIGEPRSRAMTKKPLVVLEEIPAAPITGPEFEAREGASEVEIAAASEKREREELERQRAAARRPAEIAREEYEASSSLREDVEPVPVPVFDAPAPGAEPDARPRLSARSLLGDAAGADRRGALRRAFVLNEVLGRPIALRAGAQSTGGLER